MSLLRTSSFVGIRNIMAPKSKKDKNNYTEFKSAFLCSTLQPVRKRRVLIK